MVEIDYTESCPSHNCDFETINDKMDKCKTCGYEITY